MSGSVQVDPLPSADIDPIETREWLDALDDVFDNDGSDRVRFLLDRLVERSRADGIEPSLTTPYTNSLAEDLPYPGDLEIERKLSAALRWNAMAIVARANKKLDGIGGHIATYQSVAELFEVGFQHFWRAANAEGGGDLVFFQGHASPGIYARAFLEGRLSADELDRFRQEVGGGLSSYPHPWLMPDFWQFATVSMGLGPLMAIYQARFLKYLGHRQLIPANDRKVWAFLGDGEMDEPESLGALTVAGRERLDNLIFVVNCNLQRLDGPVRGNAKIIQELEALFRGAGWRVLKVMWSSEWDSLLAADLDGRLRRRLLETVDGEWQNYAAKGGAYFRSHFFGQDPELLARVAHLSDAELQALRRGGHDPRKVFTAYRAASETVGQPIVILAHTVKGFGMGTAGEALNPAHQQKKMPAEALRAFRDRFAVPVDDAAIEKVPYVELASGSQEERYLKERRAALGGAYPTRRREAAPLSLPELKAYERLLGASAERSTTRAFVDVLASVLLRDAGLKPHLVPILADEARTFGMEGLFKQIGIYAPFGQLYEPVDSDQLMSYKESQSGQILQEGINEGGAIASWIAAGTSYSNHGLHMVPFFIFYSMFGFQRVGDFIWAAADMQTRGFLLGATSGRTTLNGEGLQHEDGHSHLIAATVPNCIAYDPTFQYEVAVIMQDGLRRMFGPENESVFYYLTLLNENYTHPAMPAGAEEGIRRGMYLFRAAANTQNGRHVQLLGSGAILREVIAAAEMLEKDFSVTADIWSCPSFVELRRDGLRADRQALLSPDEPAPKPYVAICLEGHTGPAIAATDYMKALPDLIRPWVDRRYVVLGTDGFGRSDTREQLRHFFEVDRRWVALAALKALADEGSIPRTEVKAARDRFGLDPQKPDPTMV
jgi:pyruvate dehydrogenase E1 component